MILVDIHIPLLNETCDFELDEEAEICQVLKEVLCIIARKENLSLRDEEHMQLFALEQEDLLDKRGTIKEQGVKAGDRLVLI